MTEESDRQIKETTPTGRHLPSSSRDSGILSPHSCEGCRVTRTTATSLQVLGSLSTAAASSRNTLGNFSLSCRAVSNCLQEVCLVEGSESEVLQHANRSLLCQLMRGQCNVFIWGRPLGGFRFCKYFQNDKL